MKSSTRPRVTSRQHGAALIEALVSVLILSIGLLGMVGLQTSAIRYEQNSWARTAVSNQVSDIADRIRANPDTVINGYTYTPTYTIERAAIDTNPSTVFNIATDCLTVPCNAAQLTTFDLTQWRRNLNTRIPGSVGFISGDSNSAYNVSIAWFDKSWLVDGDATALQQATQCTAAMTTVAARNCCPAGLEAPVGVRCVNFSVIP